MATAELAVAIPILVFVLALALAAVRVGREGVQCDQAARTAARQVARGDDPASAQAAVAALLPPGATLAIARAGGSVTVSVTSAGRRWAGVPLPGCSSGLTVQAEQAWPTEGSP